MPFNYTDIAYQTDQASIARRRKLIETLMQGGQRQQMAGGMVIPISGAEALGDALAGWLGGRNSKKLDEESKSLDTKYQSEQQQRLAEGLSQYDKLSRGSPAEPIPYAGGMTADEQGNTMPQAMSQALAPDPRGANMALINSQVPALQQAGIGGLLSAGKQEAFTLKPGERRFQGKDVVAEVPAEAPQRKPGELRNIIQGGKEVQQEWDGKAWQKVGEGPRWQPPQGDGTPKAPPGYRWAADGQNLEAIPGGPATQRPPSEQYLKQQTGVENIRNAITTYRDALKGMTATDYVNPNARAKMGTVYNNMLLQAKEAYNLGVLNGPDYMILQQVVTNPMSLRGLATSKGALDEQAGELDKLMAKIGTTSAGVHNQQAPGNGGLTPNPDGSFNYVPKKRR